MRYLEDEFIQVFVYIKSIVMMIRIMQTKLNAFNIENL